MRSFFFLLFIHVSFLTVAQKIEFRNDSLFINSCFVHGMTSKPTLDSLLNDEGKLKNVIGHYKPGTKEVAKLAKITYKKAGLIFSKYNYDSSKLSVAIKLHKNINPAVDQNNMPTKTFKGSFFIDSNYMNDKRTVDQLQKLRNCSVNCKESIIAQQTGTSSCDILYQQRRIRGLFDFQTNVLTCIFID